MAGTYAYGRNCKIAIGATDLTGFGTWSLDGITSDTIDISEFGTVWKAFANGQTDGGTLSFDGLFDVANNTTGHWLLYKYNAENTDVTNIRLYYSSVSYFEPCQTTLYMNHGIYSTGVSTILSSVKIQSVSIKADKNDAVRVTCTAKVSGMMAAV